MKKLLSILGLSILSLASLANINFSKSSIIKINKNTLLSNKNQNHSQVKPLIDMSLKNNDQTKDYLDKIFIDKNLISKLKIELVTIVKQDEQGNFIYQNDANSVLSLDLESSNISNIKGLEIFINLNDLDLAVNDGIVDISPLSKLTQLKKLNLVTCVGIVDISPLSKLIKLEQLFFYLNSNIKNFYPLANLINLKQLSLAFLSFSDISFLSQLVNLVILDLSGDTIFDFLPLENIKDLEQISLYEAKINNPKSLVVVKSVTDLNLKHTFLLDYSFLSLMPWLINLDLSLNVQHIIDASFLGSIINLKNLNLNANDITNIDSLANLLNLVKLDLKNNDIPNTNQAWAPLHQLPHYDPSWDNQEVRNSQGQ